MPKTNLVTLGILSLLLLSVEPMVRASDLFEKADEQLDKENKARCGERPEEPGMYDKAVRTKKLEASERYADCYRRLEAERAESTKKYMRDQVDLVFQVHEACRGAMKRRSRAPQTLSFELYRYEPGLGYNSANVDTTAGGYSVAISGSDSDGPFRVRCFMDKAYTVGAVR